MGPLVWGLWLQMVTNGYKWLQMVTNGYKWLQMVTNGYKWLQTNHKPAFRRRPEPRIQLVRNDDNMRRYNHFIYMLCPFVILLKR